jgi:hypothetical protein
MTPAYLHPLESRPAKLEPANNASEACSPLSLFGRPGCHDPPGFLSVATVGSFVRGVGRSDSYPLKHLIISTAQYRDVHGGNTEVHVEYYVAAVSTSVDRLSSRHSKFMTMTSS